MTVCNLGSYHWAHLAVRITNRVSIGETEPLDVPLFAKVGSVESSRCVNIPKTEFFSAGWKKIPAPSELNIVRVELLASLCGTGYIEKKF